MMSQSANWKNMILMIVGFITILSGLLIRDENRFTIGLFIIVVGFLLYFLMVYSVAERNWLDVRAAFSGVWIVTIGLAALRLNDYQEQWQRKTWILLAVSYLVYQIGATIGTYHGKQLYGKLDVFASRIQFKHFFFKLKKERLFSICVGITLIGMLCFSINVAIKGFVPLFSSSLSAYVDFYTKFHMFSVAATSVSGLCYYCIKTQPLNKVKKSILWVCIIYLVILFPILVVSRGTFVVAAVSMTTTIYYLNQNKFRIFVLCLVTIMGIYLFASNLRGYSDEYLEEHFEPTKTESFVISPKMAFLYAYLTVSHDNFNEAVENTKGYTWGARQFSPFNAILRIQAIRDMRDNGEWYQVRPHLNTVNMLGVFYYDFHEWGVVICTFLWAVIFGIMQGFYLKSRGAFSLQILSYAMNPIVLSFFASWVNMLTLWVFWGVICICGVLTRIRFRCREE